MERVQKKPNSSVQHTPSSESFQVYLCNRYGPGIYPSFRCGLLSSTYKTMERVQNKPNSSVQHTPSSESFQVYQLLMYKYYYYLFCKWKSKAVTSGPIRTKIQFERQILKMSWNITPNVSLRNVLDVEYGLPHACGQRDNEKCREATAACALTEIALEKPIPWYTLISFSRNTTNFTIALGAADLFRMDRMSFNNAVSTSYVIYRQTVLGRDLTGKVERNRMICAR
jgi:hypothetical protein